VPNAEALERYAALPLPDTTEEHWRFTDLSGFDPDSFDHGLVPGTGTGPEGTDSYSHAPVPGTGTGLAQTLLDLDVAGLATIGEAGVEVEGAPAGVTFAPLTEEHERLYSLVGWDEKFAAHNAALWKHGVLVVVPRGVELEKPLYVRIGNARPGGSLFWRLLVVAEAGARFTLVEETSSAAADLPSYTNAAVELFIEQDAKLEYVSLQNLSRETWHFAAHHARVERGAELDWVAGGFGSKKGKVRIQNDLAGEGATSRVTGAYFADGDQHLDYDTFQEHIAPNTTSDFAFKGALRDRSTAVWRGMIRVERDAQRTNAYQENRNLMLSPTTHAVPIPGLEILANDVRCTHGATVSRVNRDELFYAMARGLPRSEAERLIVRGFFQDILDRIELEPVREAVTGALEARIPQG
jgi:Fe-S cluster assembly protein SufD